MSHVPRARAVGVGLLATAALIAAPIAAAHAATTFLTSETFRGTAVTHTAEWVQGGTEFTPCLTAGADTAQTPVPGCNASPINTDGNGALRLTPLGGNQAGFVLSKHALPTAGGLDVTFTQAQYGGGGADGISFFVVDGSTDLTSPGALGGALGYSTNGSPGVAHGLFGIGLDAYGNFSSPGADGTGCAPAPAPYNSGHGGGANNVVLRGPGNGTAGYCYVSSSLEQGHTVDLFDDDHETRDSAALTVHIVVDPSTAPSPKLTVSIGDTQVLQADEPASFGAASTFKFGFASSTGGIDDIQEIWDLTVNSQIALAPKLALAVAGQGVAPVAGSTATVVYSGSTLPSGGTETGALTLTHQLPGGATVAALPTGTGWDCSATVVGSSTMSCRFANPSGVTPGATVPDVTASIKVPPVVVTAFDLATGATLTNGTESATGTGSIPIGVVLPTRTPYFLTGSDGGVFAYDQAKFFGSTGAMKLNRPIVGAAATATHLGYWLAASDGGVFSFGDAVFHGSHGGSRLNSPIVGIAATPTGLGYWLFAADGGVFSYGDAVFHGSHGGSPLVSPVVGAAATPDGLGYWLVAADGGVFSYGSAVFHGSNGATKVTSPVVGIASTPAGDGYWIVAKDGTVSHFGGAADFGSMAAKTLRSPIVGIAATADGKGYLLGGADGGVFAFGNATFGGSHAGSKLVGPIVSITS